MKKCIVFSYFLLIFHFAANAQMDILFGQTRTVFMENIDEPTGPDGAISEANSHKNEINSTGTGAFSGISYSDLDDNDCGIGATDDWEPVSHIENLARMAEGYALAVEDVNDNSENDIANALILGLQYWYSLNETTSPLPACPVDGDPDDGCSNMFPEDDTVPSVPWCCDNWWWNYIGKQRELSKIGILFYDRLTGTNAPTVPNSNPTRTLLQAIINDMPDDVEKYSNEANETEKYTGANLTDVAAFVMMKGILSHDYTDFNANNTNVLVSFAITEFEEGALSPASQVACNTYDDGIQADFSFFQHNKILYSSGYGYSFIRSLSLWGSALSGNTTFFFDNEHQNFLLDAILEGWRWMIRGNTADYSVSGRYITRDYGGNHTSIPLQHMVWLVELAEGVNYDCLPLTHPNYEAPQTNKGIALEKMKNDALDLNRQDILGNKYFWKSDYVAHHEEAFFSSIKMCAREDETITECGETDDVNRRTSGTESRNGDNEDGFWLPYGCTFIYQRGDEYEDIFTDSDFDWNKIPGVTSAELSGSDLKPGKGDEEENTHNSNFVGSAGNHSYAVTTLELDKDYDNNKHLSARKAWFHFGDEIIALGGGILDNSGEDVFTTMNQSLLVGSVTEATSAVSGNLWIHHDHTAYVYLNPNASNAVFTDDVESDDADDIFSAWINHEDNTENKPTVYFYRVVPGITDDNTTNLASTVESFITNNPVTIFVNEEVNNSYRQAVKKGDLVGIIHYPPTDELDPFIPHSISIGDQTNPVVLSTNKPCAIFYDLSTNQVCISSPDRSVNDVLLTATINGQTYSGTIVLPTGEMAGTSKCENLLGISGSHVRTYCEDTDDNMDGLLDGNGAGIADVEIYDDTPQTPNLLATTNTVGSYAIPNLLYGSNYILNPKKDIEYYNGVSSYDLLLMQKHILQLQILDSPYKLIAADVNKSGGLTTVDMVELRRLILHYFEDLPAVDSWEFVRASHLFPNINNPFQANINYPGVWPFPQTAEVDGLELINGKRDFIGIKMGDVSCPAIGGVYQVPPCPDQLQLLVEDKAVLTNEVFTIPIRSKNFENIAAYQFALEYETDKLEYQSTQQGDLHKGADPENFKRTAAVNLLSLTNTDLIRTSWLQNDASDPSNILVDTTLTDSSSLFVLTFKALTDISAISEVFNLKSTGFQSAAWKVGTDCEQAVTMQYFGGNKGEKKNAGQSSLKNSAKTVQINPNPVSGNLTFDITNATASENTILIYSPTGQLIKQEQIYLEEGNNTFTMKNISNWQKGLYFYTIADDAGEMSTGKFVKQ